MKDVHPLWGLLIFAVFVTINHILYAFKTAIKNVSEEEIEKERNGNDKKVNSILQMMEKPSGFNNTLRAITIMIDITVGVLLIGVFSNALMTFDFVHSKTLVVAVVTIIMFVILEVFGVMLPSKLAVKKSKVYIFKYFATIRFLQIVFSPIIFVMNSFTNVILGILGVAEDIDEENVTEEGIIDMVNEGQEQGVLLESEAKMITNIFEFSNKQAEDIMVNRKNVIAIDGETTFKAAIKAFLYMGFSRMPVYKNDIDNIVGILHFKDAFKICDEGEKSESTILEMSELLYDAHFIPETRGINDLFKEMQTEKFHMAIVIDEYGQTAGLVTLEDIIEEIVGNIVDEHDMEDNTIKKKTENEYVVEGLIRLEDLEDLLGIKFDEEVDTLNGFIISRIEKIPEDEEYEIEYQGYIFKVLKVDNKMITEVRIIKNDKDIQVK